MLKFFIVVYLALATQSRNSPKRTDSKHSISMLHLPSQEHYWMELGFLFILTVLGGFFIFGKRKNEKIARNIYLQLEAILKKNFSLIGDNEDIEVFKESHNCFHIFASGRKNIQTFDICLQLLPRQDLVGLLFSFFNSEKDKIIISTQFDDNVTPFIFLISHRKDELNLRSTRREIKEFTPSPPSVNDAFNRGSVQSTTERFLFLPKPFQPQLVAAPEHPLLMEEILKRGLSQIVETGFHIIRFMCTDDPYHDRSYEIINESKEKETNAGKSNETLQSSSSSSSSAAVSSDAHAKTHLAPCGYPDRLNMELALHLPSAVLSVPVDEDFDEDEQSEEEDSSSSYTSGESFHNRGASSKQKQQSTSQTTSQGLKKQHQKTFVDKDNDSSTDYRKQVPDLKQVVSSFIILADNIAEIPLPRDVTARIRSNRLISQAELKKEAEKEKEKQERKKMEERKRREEKPSELSASEQRKKESKLSKAELQQKKLNVIRNRSGKS